MIRAPTPAAGAQRASPRESDILGLIGEGPTGRQIGQRLYLSEKTVKNNVCRLLAKPGVERRGQAAVILARGMTPTADTERGHR
ncbi:regulatory protein, luxR family [Streptomyces sp. DvalAA-14]|nr:regulatory protein, luxR family [Streptomyces sp. DvalAA-14]